jgi:hypothetical protein
MGEESVQDLRIGDLVHTHDGDIRPVKWIGRRTYSAAQLAADPSLRPVRVRKGALGDAVPARDLVVSPFHALLVDGLLAPAASLVNGVSIQREGARTVAYLHIELDDHALILAEGAPCESFVDADSRRMFENAADYVARYPETPPPPSMPRTESGFALEAVRRRLGIRAGVIAERRPPGVMHGHIERLTEDFVEGWAHDDGNPDAPVAIELRIPERPPELLLANRYRADLERAGIGNGRHGFRHRLPPGTRTIWVGTEFAELFGHVTPPVRRTGGA